MAVWDLFSLFLLTVFTAIIFNQIGTGTTALPLENGQLSADESGRLPVQDSNDLSADNLNQWLKLFDQQLTAHTAGEKSNVDSNFYVTAQSDSQTEIHFAEDESNQHFAEEESNQHFAEEESNQDLSVQGTDQPNPQLMIKISTEESNRDFNRQPMILVTTDENNRDLSSHGKTQSYSKPLKYSGAEDESHREYITHTTTTVYVLPDQRNTEEVSSPEVSPAWLSGNDKKDGGPFASTNHPRLGMLLRKRRDAAVVDNAFERPLIPPKYGLVVHVHNVEASSNRSIDSTILRLKVALAAELPWPIQAIHVEKINVAGSQIEFYLEDDMRRLVPVRQLMSDNLLARLSQHVPDLGLIQVSEERNLAVAVGDDDPIWTKSYFPYVVAGASVFLVLVLSLLIYCCCCRSNKKKEDLDEEVVVGHAIYYPSLKPELADPTPVQPDSPIPTFTATGVTTPVPAQPIRIKAKGLLERRGSNASLTLDLNPSSDLGRWEGTPPKESTALEYLMSAGNRLSRRDLRNVVKHTKILYEEFWEIPMNHTEKVSVAGSGMKNRYKTIIPNEYSRVILPDIDNDPLNSYINANYIRGYEGEPRAYIATQGAMAHTVMDFWRMIWFEKCPIIVMITKLKEKSKPKCENYLPERWGVYGDIEVVIDKIIYKKGFVVRHITLRSNGESQSVLHYWYTAWPDHKPPESPNMLLDLIKEVELRRYQPNDISPRGPVCVHCSAGIGRTGCFIAISIGIRQLREEHSVDALGIVCAMRIDRGGMIQTHEQYDFVHQALAVYERELGEPSVQSITALTSESVTTP